MTDKIIKNSLKSEIIPEITVKRQMIVISGILFHIRIVFISKQKVIFRDSEYISYILLQTSAGIRQLHLFYPAFPKS